MRTTAVPRSYRMTEPARATSCSTTQTDPSPNVRTGNLEHHPTPGTIAGLSVRSSIRTSDPVVFCCCTQMAPPPTASAS